ncbi:MAG: hypothetical protein OXC25_14925 [Thiotrichales bacterium]|nr:hypothetical protein [Thiotrichales bacterium]MCY4351134.1 hypothetical protein [Thiotrichales bacterium]
MWANFAVFIVGGRRRCHDVHRDLARVMRMCDGGSVRRPVAPGA